MPYRVTDLKRNGNTWTGTLQEWQGCVCESDYTPFTLEQETSPTMKDIIGILGR